MKRSSSQLVGNDKVSASVSGPSAGLGRSSATHGLANRCRLGKRGCGRKRDLAGRKSLGSANCQKNPFRLAT